MPQPVSLVTIHNEGLGAPTDYPRGAHGGYTVWIGTTKFTKLRSVWSSYATLYYNGVSYDICLSGDRHTGYPVTDHDIELIRDACALGRANGELVDNPMVRDHRSSPGSLTACSGDHTRDVWPEVVAACQASPIIIPVPEPPTSKGGAVELQRTKSGKGYYIVASDGGVFCFGDAKFFGSMGGKHLNAPVVGMAIRPQDDGYLLVAADGGVFAFGRAPYRGSMGGKHLNAPIIDIEFDADGDGYWLLAEDGGIFTFGPAGFYGSAVGKVTT